MVHELPCCGLSEIERPLDPGWIDWTPELPRTLSWLRWRTSWHASHGPYYRAEKTIAHYRASLQRERADPVTAPLQRIKGLPTEVCTGTARTKEQSQRRAFNLIPKMVSNDRPTCKDRHAAELIMARRNDLHSKTEYIAADFLRLDTFPLQSCGGPYIFGHMVGLKWGQYRPPGEGLRAYLIVVRLAYSSFGYQVAPRPAGVRSRIVHKGSASGAPRGSWPVSAIS